MSLFKQFPKIDYDLELTNELQTLIDISRLVDANDILSADSVAYTKYNIIDGARPDIISQLLYNTPEYYWTFFIANDHLKDGYRAWPKSEVGFEKYIEENYDSVVMTSPPFSAPINWSFNRFPLNQYLSIYNKNNTEERIYFKEYDEETYSVKFKRVNDSDFQKVIFDLSETISISWPEFVNPHNVFSQKYQEVEEIRKQWNIDFFTYMQTLSEVDFTFYSEQAFSGDNAAIQVGSDAYYQRFADYMATQSFPYFRNFRLEKNAPHHYLDNGERVSAYNAFNPDGRVNNNPDFVTNYEYEKQLNDDRAEIKVIRPERIDEFARRFKELINE